jgi:hypothetical protein
VNTRSVAATLLLLLGSGAVSLAAQEPEPETHAGLGQGETHVRGYVTDRSTGQPMAGVSVVMRDSEGTQSALRLTSDDGTFHFASVRSGVYEMELRHLGYQEVDLTLDTGEGSHTEVRVEMVPAAVELEPVVVTSSRRDRLSTAGFYDRRRVASGHFITRDELRSRQIFRVSQIFRGVAGFTVVPATNGFDQYVIGRGNCHPALYIDGILMQTVAGSQIDQVLQPDHLEGLEIYSASQTPGQFLAGRCGTIVAWTHTPTSVDGHAFEWRRLGAAAGLIVAVFTVFF